MTALIAEIGGVMFHVSKLAQHRLAEVLFLVVYSITRMVAFPIFIAWLYRSILFTPAASTTTQAVNLWAASGTAVLVKINISWCLKQWQVRYTRARGR